MAKKTTKRAGKKHEGLRMSDGMRDKYAELIATALESMETSGYTKPWVSPHMGTPCNLYRKTKPYKGMNAFMLTMLMELRGFETPYFITKNQMKGEDYTYNGLTANATLMLDESGCAVLDDKGMPKLNVEKRFPVIFFKPIHKDEDGQIVSDEDYETLSFDEKQRCRTFFYQSSYQVYNIDQTDFATVYPDVYKKMTATPPHEYKEGTRDEVLEKIIGGEWICPILLGGHESFFNATRKEIRLPRREAFLGDQEFYGAALHEMAHSVARELELDVPGAPFGSEDYAMDELKAELSSAIMCSMLGIGKLLNKNSIAYVQSWKGVLRTKKDVVPVVLDAAQRIVNFFMKKYDEVAGGHGTLSLEYKEAA